MECELCGQDTGFLGRSICRWCEDALVNEMDLQAAARQEAEQSEIRRVQQLSAELEAILRDEELSQERRYQEYLATVNGTFAQPRGPRPVRPPRRSPTPQTSSGWDTFESA